MSIINEALKKTQEKMEESDGKNKGNKDVSALYEKMHKNTPGEAEPPNAPGKQTTSGSEDQNKQSKTGPLLVVFFILATVFLVMKFNLINDAPRISRKIKGIFSGSSSTNKKKAPMPARVYETGTLVLSGTISRDEGKAALINGRMYQVGDQIDNKTVEEISMQTVRLRDKNNQLITLRVGEEKK